MHHLPVSFRFGKRRILLLLPIPNMIPMTALIILIVIVAVCSLTVLVAIYSRISTYLEPGTSEQHKSDKDPPPPLSARAAPSSIGDTLPLPGQNERPETRGAEYPPPLPDDLAESESPPPLPADRDSTHEIIELYTPEGRKRLLQAPMSAPAKMTTFDQAESKWAYIGQRRAESSIV